ncbi:MAG: hypothetical protein ACSLE9_01790 [Burkholderiaceae bacterium]
MTGRAPARAIATWLALLGGSLGLHRLYLRGRGDRWAWLHWPPTLVGAYGFWRMRHFGTDDTLGSLLVLLLGAMVASTMLLAIVHGLTSDERWREQHPGTPAIPVPAWIPVLGAIVALAVGASVAMATIAFAAQRWFEWRAG